jgi:PAS domain S-box-containing protein
LKCRFIEAYEYEDVLELVNRGIVDAGVVNRSFGLEFEGNYNINKSSIIFSPTEVHFAVPKKKHRKLIETIDNYMVVLKSDKRSIYHQSIDKWIPVGSKWIFPTWLMVLLAVGSGLLLLFLVTGLIFRSQVKAKTAELSIANQELLGEIAERKRVEEALRLTQFSVDHAGDAVFWMGSDARFIYVNETACRSLGYSREELLAMTVHDIDPNFPTEVWPEHWEDVTRRGAFIIESQHRTKGDKVFPVEITVNYIEFKGKKYNCAFARDITERKKAEHDRDRLESQLLHAQKMEAVGTLAGGIAHDFNNLLQAVQGYAELLVLRRGKEEPGYRELQEISRAATRGGELTQQLLTFSRRDEIKLHPIDLNREVLNVKELLLRTIPKMIEIKLHLAGNLKTINADPGQIEQILMNLAVNAKDSMPEGGKLVIETENTLLDEKYCETHLGAKRGEYVLLTISDTGQGMNKETLEHIFEPFYTTKGVGEGTGLGLAMVYGLVKSHHGYITCYSEPGEGTAFKIYLPVIEQERESVEPKETEIPIIRGTGTILLVDDEDFIRDLGQRILTEFGYTALTAADGETALELYSKERQRIDLVILDLIMPGIGGRKCLNKLLEIDPQANVLIASGYSQNGPTREILQAGAKGFVSKPYEIKQLLGAVRKVLDQT